MKPEFTPEQADRIAKLVARVVEKGEAFKVFPPKEVTDDPSVLRSSDAPTRLAGTKWWLRFGEDDEQLLTFTELMVLTHDVVRVNMILAREKQRLSDGQTAKAEITLHDDEQILTPESVTTLLSKLRLEGIDRQVTFPVYGIHEGGPDEAFQTAVYETPDPDNPGKNLRIIMLFTNLADAQPFAKLRGRGIPIPVARSHEELKEFLKGERAEVVQFDPRIVGNQIELRGAMFVKAILADQYWWS